MILRRGLLGLALSAALALSACGGAAPPEPTVAPLERPTSTPRPTVTPEPEPTEKPAEEPTEKPAEEPTPKTLGDNEPTAAPTDGQLAQVVVDGLDTYTHAGGLFTIDVPTNWSIEDKSDESRAAVTWSDPTNNALVIVQITQETSELSQDELGARLQSIVDFAKDEPGFSSDPPENLSGGGVQIIWGYEATADGGVTARLLGNSFIYQYGDKLAVLMLVVPNEQFDGLKESLDSILNSFNVDSSAELGAAPVAVDDNLPGGTRYEFSEDDGSWPVESSDQVEASVGDGIYTLRILQPDQYYIVNPDMDNGSTQGIAATVNPSGDARAGVFLRLRKDSGKSSFYACWIDANSRYGCFVSDQGKWKTLQDATESSDIIAGAPNRLRMTIDGDQLSFSVNGVELVSLSDSRVDAGRAGLYLENFSDPVEATYDDVVISSE